MPSIKTEGPSLPMSKKHMNYSRPIPRKGGKDDPRGQWAGLSGRYLSGEHSEDYRHHAWWPCPHSRRGRLHRHQKGRFLRPRLSYLLIPPGTETGSAAMHSRLICSIIERYFSSILIDDSADKHYLSLSYADVF